MLFFTSFQGKMWACKGTAGVTNAAWQASHALWSNEASDNMPKCSHRAQQYSGGQANAHVALHWESIVNVTLFETPHRLRKPENAGSSVCNRSYHHESMSDAHVQQTYYAVSRQFDFKCIILVITY
jgi:hypothetical protein